MIFNSASFLWFLIVVIAGSLVLTGRGRVAFLTAMSFVFYAEAHPPHLVLLLVSIVSNYWLVKRIGPEADPRHRRKLLALIIVLNLAALFYFKYAGPLVKAFHVWLGLPQLFPGIEPQLPIGISFYVFEAISYAVDVYSGRCRAAESLLDFAFFLSFFPHLVAGPIVRAGQLLPQIPAMRPFARESLAGGVELVLLGLFKKCVLADNISPSVETVFSPLATPGPVEVWLGSALFAVQIYADFSGYSDIARGVARMLDVELCENFSWPYLQPSLTRFWSAWHISLSTWIRDYVYFPLAISLSRWRWIGGHPRLVAAVSVLASMTACGLWHGPAATYLAWGFFHGLMLVIASLLPAAPRRRKAGDALAHFVRLVAGHVGTVVVVLVGWVIFRSASLGQAVRLIGVMFGAARPATPTILPGTSWKIGFVAGLLLVHVMTSCAGYGADRLLLFRLPYVLRVLLIPVVALLLLVCAGGQSAFIYFAF